MSNFNLKFTKGAPASLMTGMIVRCRGKMVLIGTHTPPSVARVLLAEGAEWAQAVSDYELDWLGDNGIPAKAAG
jgi:hypothetical protein